MALLNKFLTVPKREFNPYKKLYKSTILKQMARPQWVNDNLRRNKVGKITYFFLTVPFFTFFSENTLDKLSQFMWAKVAVGRTVTL
jgi:uncharacterized HAD superfamily protein